MDLHLLVMMNIWSDKFWERIKILEILTLKFNHLATITWFLIVALSLMTLVSHPCSVEQSPSMVFHKSLKILGSHALAKEGSRGGVQAAKMK